MLLYLSKILIINIKQIDENKVINVIEYLRGI